jgi:hypothetical protein
VEYEKSDPGAPKGQPDDPPVALQTFAMSLRGNRVRNARGVVIAAEAGHADEIWLKLLARAHGMEKRSVSSWQALIEHYRGQPAHPSVTGG